MIALQTTKVGDTPPSKPLRIAAFGFRSFPPRGGSAGADKFALELLPRLAARGHSVVAYNRVYPNDSPEVAHTYRGVSVIPLRTISYKGFDTLLHSAKATWDIVLHNRADLVHIQNGGNSVFAIVLRLFGKQTFLSQDGLDWKREKWPWYAKIFLLVSAFLTAYVHNAVIFDNVFARRAFEARFRRHFNFVPFGADVKYEPSGEAVLERLDLTPGEYFLFVGRFIPDKGLHWLIPAFEALATTKKLVLVGGAPNPSDYDNKVRETKDPRILFTGFLYGSEVHALMRNCYAYVQPSAVEGLSPVILEASFLGAPVICSDIPQNTYGLAEHGVYFKVGDVSAISEKLRWALAESEALSVTAKAAKERVTRLFSWDAVVDQHVRIFSGLENTEKGREGCDPSTYQPKAS